MRVWAIHRDGAGASQLVPGGQYGFGFAAFLIVEKCAVSIPIYRIERRFERLGTPMSRATMNDILHAAAELATPLIERLRARIAALPIVLADETSMRPEGDAPLDAPHLPPAIA